LSTERNEILVWLTVLTNVPNPMFDFTFCITLGEVGESFVWWIFLCLVNFFWYGNDFPHSGQAFVSFGSFSFALCALAVYSDYVQTLFHRGTMCKCEGIETFLFSRAVSCGFCVDPFQLGMPGILCMWNGLCRVLLLGERWGQPPLQKRLHVQCKGGPSRSNLLSINIGTDRKDILGSVSVLIKVMIWFQE
jgi:hypothetical protein